MKKALATYPGPPRGEDSPNAKITEDDVREMRRLHKLGFGAGKIAASFEMSRAMVGRIITGKSWAHVK